MLSKKTTRQRRSWEFTCEDHIEVKRFKTWKSEEKHFSEVYSVVKERIFQRIPARFKFGIFAW